MTTNVPFSRSTILASLISAAAVYWCVAAVAQQPGQSPATLTSGAPANPPSDMPPPAATSQPAKSAERLRENTRLVDVTGVFQSVGADSVTFSPTGSKEAYRLLQNLALERLSRTLEENRGSRPGMASGIITEFRGSNYLLITKAIFQSQDGEAVAGK
jgi:hypothetical protein